MIELQSVSYGYQQKHVYHPILQDLSYQFDTGSCYAISGPSGSGKTTLLSLLSGFDRPCSGKILIDGADLATLDLNFYRAKTIGVIFQNYNLLSHLNAAENVQLALRLASVPSSLEAALALLAEVGIGRETATRSVTALSGGEQQRVAIARALAGNPHIILADEPTGNLDQENQQTILNIFLSLAHEQGKCVIIASHASELVQSADYVLELYTQRHN